MRAVLCLGLYLFILCVNHAIYTSENYALNIAAFDALTYYEKMTSDIQKYIQKTWLNNEPVFMQVKPYSVYVATKEYPICFDASGLVTIGMVDNSLKGIQLKLFERNFHMMMLGDQLVPVWETKSLQNRLQSNPVRICGPDTKRHFCFVNNQLLVLPTQEYCVSSAPATHVGKEVIRLGLEKIQEDCVAQYRTHFCFNLYALASDGLQAVLALNNRTCPDLWLCDMPRFGDSIQKTEDHSTDLSDVQDRSVFITKLCTVGTVASNQRICIPENNTVVIFDCEMQEVRCVCCTDTSNSCSEYKISIPHDYVISNMHGLDNSPYCVFDMSHKKTKERVLGLWSFENKERVTVALLAEYMKSLRIAPNCSTPKKFTKEEILPSALYVQVQTPELWDALLYLRVAEQLCERTSWTLSEQQRALGIIQVMQEWAQHRTINPYYICWLAQTPKNNSNHFLEIYRRLHPNTTKTVLSIPHKIRAFFKDVGSWVSNVQE